MHLPYHRAVLIFLFFFPVTVEKSKNDAKNIFPFDAFKVPIKLKMVVYGTKIVYKTKRITKKTCFT